ncbi:hypothetical protein RJ639_014152 [Escallonia herrerae]|uniref:Uncharacterized protein n=1 Tax=Escallonia herrerae TaxID=1293975 RepID=A0AA89AMI7_9ASTE|nr:hypothetical protein RJ639_014152 [Escallonia herrerae]
MTPGLSMSDDPCRTRRRRLRGHVDGSIEESIKKVLDHNSALAELCSAKWYSTRAECLATIMLWQNCARPSGILLGQSAQPQFCLSKIMLGRMAFCSNRVLVTILLGQNHARPSGILLRQSARPQFCMGRIVFDSFPQWVPTSGSEVGTLNPQPPQPLTSQPVQPSSSQPSQPLASQPSHYLPAKNALGNVKDQAKDKANPKPWYTVDEKSSKMSTEDLLELIQEYPLPEGWYARLPILQEPANYETRFETEIYEEQVKSGYRLPLHPFALCFFEHYHMASGQLVPNGWRKLDRLIYSVQTSGYKTRCNRFYESVLQNLFC